MLQLTLKAKVHFTFTSTILPSKPDGPFTNRLNKRLTVEFQLRTTFNNKTMEKTKRITPLICELSRLKSQQKYLEHSRIPDKFWQSDFSADEIIVYNKQRTDIDVLEDKLNLEFRGYELRSKNEITDMWKFIGEINSAKGEHLETTNVDHVREKILKLVKYFETMQKNNSELTLKLQSQHEELQRTLKYNINF